MLSVRGRGERSRACSTPVRGHGRGPYNRDYRRRILSGCAWRAHAPSWARQPHFLYVRVSRLQRAYLAGLAGHLANAVIGDPDARRCTRPYYSMFRLSELDFTASAIHRAARCSPIQSSVTITEQPNTRRARSDPCHPVDRRRVPTRRLQRHGRGQRRRIHGGITPQAFVNVLDMRNGNNIWIKKILFSSTRASRGDLRGGVRGGCMAVTGLPRPHYITQ